jgi:RNA polymerase sigma-70 factor (ECF subfamily)
MTCMGRTVPAAAAGEAAEQELVTRLRNGDADAFTELVDSLSPALLRIALMHVPSRAVAEEVVQETWLAVLAGIDRFEGRSTLKTWIFRILMNRAKTRGERERRTVPFASLAGDRTDGDADGTPLGDQDLWPHHWATPPQRWDESPERSAESRETIDLIKSAIAGLPERQRLVITMRDVVGLPAEEVCNVLDISETNQRVLLHRARSAVRAALEQELAR